MHSFGQSFPGLQVWDPSWHFLTSSQGFSSAESHQGTIPGPCPSRLNRSSSRWACADVELRAVIQEADRPVWRRACVCVCVLCPLKVSALVFRFGCTKLASSLRDLRLYACRLSYQPRTHAHGVHACVIRRSFRKECHWLMSFKVKQKVTFSSLDLITSDFPEIMT